MNRMARLFAGLTSLLFPYDFLHKISGNQRVVPLYHLVTNNPPLHVKHLYLPRRIETFKKDLEFLLLKYKGKTKGDKLFNLFNGGVVVTFDDGLREAYEIASPILYRMGIPAIFFINNDFVNNANLFYRFKASILIEKLAKCNSRATIREVDQLLGTTKGDSERIRKRMLNISYPEMNLLDKVALFLDVNFDEYLVENKPYMDSAQIRELQTKGFVIGAHGMNHQLLSELSDSEIVEQVQLSINDIAYQYPSPYRFFAFPFTDYGVSQKVFKAIHDPDHPIVDASFGTAGFKKDYMPNHIQRIPMEIDDISAYNILKKEYTLSTLRRMVGKSVILRKN